MKLLTVVIALRSHNLSLDLLATLFDVLLVAGTVYDGRIVLRDSNLLGSTQHFDRSLFQFQALLFADHYTTSQYGYIFQHFLTTVAKARSLHSTDLQLAAQTVHYQGSQCFAIYIFCDDQQRTACLYGGFEDRQEIFQVGNLLVVDQDVRFLHLTFHLLGIGYEVSRQITAVELHTFYHADGRIRTLSFLDGDDTVLGNLTHGVGNKLTDNRIVVGRYGTYLFDLVVVVTNHL